MKQLLTLDLKTGGSSHCTAAEEDLEGRDWHCMQQALDPSNLRMVVRSSAGIEPVK